MPSFIYAIRDRVHKGDTIANDYASIKASILTAQGTVGQLITLRGIGGTYAVQAGAVAISYVDVQDCVGTGAAIPFNDPNGIDSGNNLNWNFGVRNILYSPGAYNPIPHMFSANSSKPGGDQAMSNRPYGGTTQDVSPRLGTILQRTPINGTIKTDKPQLL